MQGEAYVEGIQPGAQLLRYRNKVGQSGAVAGGRVGVGQLGDQCSDPDVVHTCGVWR